MKTLQHSSSLTLRSLQVLLVLMWWPLVASAIKLNGYRSKDSQLLSINDIVISTLGYFKLTLVSKGCQLQVEEFIETNSSYKEVGRHTPSILKSPINCSYLKFNTTEGMLLADSQHIYFQAKVKCDSMVLTIDDTGIIHFVCNFQQGQVPPAIDYVVTTFYHPKKHIRCISDMKVNETSVLNQLVTDGGWHVSAKNGIFTISSKNNKQSSSYTYNNFTIFPSYFIGSNGLFPPEVNLSRLLYLPRCGHVSSEMFSAPYIFKMDERFPLFEVLDQSGYQVFALRFPLINCTADVGLKRSWTRSCVSWVCPPELFLLRGTCVKRCPAPYYHLMKESLENQCVLNCEKGAAIDELNRTCYCYATPPITCLPNTTPYFLGCQCTSGFYDGFGCVNKCAPGAIGFEGVCVSCPLQCYDCHFAKNNISFLICLKCNDGFIEKNNMCISECNQLMGMSKIGNECKSCNNSNCVDCSQDVSDCYLCNALTAKMTITQEVRGSVPSESTTIQYTSCNMSCKTGEVTAYYSDSKFACFANDVGPVCKKMQPHHHGNEGFIVCMDCFGGLTYLDQCTLNCKKIRGYLTPDESGRFCHCEDNTNLLVAGKCRKISGCPLNMYFNESLKSCLSCDYGCATCWPVMDVAVCTSCYPGYVLYLAPRPSCRLDSTLLNCRENQKYDGDLCMPINLSKAATSCLKKKQNCEYCLNPEVCLKCSSGYSLFNNTCKSPCPQKTFKFRSVCVQENPFDLYCESHSVANVYNYAIINYTYVANSSTYRYYTNNNTEPFNNIAGYLLSRSKSLSQSVETYFMEANYRCLKCKDGYGVNDEGKCEACVLPCVNCIRPRPQYCLSCIPEAYAQEGRSCRNLFLLCDVGQYRDHLDVCSLYCRFFYIKDHDTRLNCSQSCPPGRVPMLEADKTYLTCEKNANGVFTKLYASVFRRQDGKLAVMYIPDPPLEQIKLKPQKAPRFTINNSNPSLPRLLLSTGNVEMKSFLRQDFFYATSNDTCGESDVALLNLSSVLRDLVSTKKSYFANTLFGVQVGNSYKESLSQSMYFFGIAISALALCMHGLYIGNGLLYRADNTIILLQTIYLFIYYRFPTQMDLMQFYNGFGVAHLNFFPNLMRPIVPHLYLEQAPVGFRLVNEDANFIRNAGHSICILLIFESACLVFGLVVYLISKFSRRYDMWHPKILRLAVIAGVQIVLMNVTFFSVSQMHYGWSYCIPHKHFSFISKSLAITSIILITIFTITRLCLYRIGGINCLKRVALAIILAIIPRHNAEMGLLAVEVVYALIRICTEGAHTNALLAVIYCEEILIIVCYIVMTYHNVQILTITVLTIVVVTAICALIYGLSEIMYRTCAKMMLLPKGLMIESAAKESPMDTERLIRPPRSDNNQ